MNGLSNPYDWTDDVLLDGANPSLDAIEQASPFQIKTKSTENPLKALFRTLERIAKRQTKQFCLIIDNINYLIESVGSPIMVLDFLQYCRVMIEPRKGSLVVLAHGDSEDDTIFLNSLKFQSDIVMQIHSFSSGVSKDFDGELSFIVGPAVQIRRPENGIPSLLYKIQENGVKFQQVASKK